MMSSSKNQTNIFDKVTQLCKKGLFVDAYQLGLEHWGDIDQWQSIEQTLLAIKISFQLGGDRQSDFILLRAYRNDRNNLELVERMLYYYLHKIGPILCQEKLDAIESTLSPSSKDIPELYLFKSVLYRELKHFVRAETYFELAHEAGNIPDYADSLACRLLLEQDLDEQALEMAKKHFEQRSTISNLRTYIVVLQKTQNLEAGLALLINNIDTFQSSSLYLQMAGMAVSALDWESCEKAIKQYESTKQFTDKYEAQKLASYKAQLAIYKGRYKEANELLKTNKTPYWEIIYKNLLDIPNDASIKVLDLPFYRQEHLTCAPTTLAALAEFWGKTYSSKEIADQICYGGTPDTKERQWLRDNQFYFVEFDLTEAYLYYLIDAGIPFGLVSTSGFSAHLQAVIGYNKFVGTFYTMDPSTSGMQEILLKENLQSEAFSGPRCIAFVPIDDKQKLADFCPFENTMYAKWDEYAVARENNDPQAMHLCLLALEKLSNTHRLYIKAARDYALWLKDYNKVQQFNAALLSDYPNESVLLNSQYFCLRDLGRREEALDYLEQYLDKQLNISLACVLLGEIYDTNERPKTVSKLISTLKRYGSYQEDAHFAIANYYWNNGQREKAKEAYLFAHCLDVTNDTYLESYFKASRYFNEEIQAIDYLKRRYIRYLQRSPLPAISLFNAYELCNEEHKGFEYLEEAFTRHNTDKTIARVLGKKLIAYGLFDKFEQYKKQIEQSLTSNEFQDLNAHLLLKQGQLEGARAHYEKRFVQHPFITEYAEAYFGLLKKMECSEELDTYLAQLYEKNLNHTIAQDYVIAWHSNEKLQQQVLIDALLARPDNAWLRQQLIDKYLRFGEKDKALRLAAETVQILGNDPNSYAYFAKARKQIGQFDKAVEQAKKALSMNIDNDLAFQILLQSTSSNEQRVQRLSFVLEHIKSQVTFGEALWNYWFEAQYLLPEKDLGDFVDYVLNEHSHLWYSYMVAAFFYKNNGDIEKAIELVLQGTDKFPFMPRLFKELGSLYELNKQNDKAVEAFNNALLINPAWSEVAKQLADYYEKRGEFDTAIKLISDTIKHTPDDGILYGYLADFYLQKSDSDSALKALYKAVEFSPEYDWAWTKIQQIADEKKQANLAYEQAEKLAKQYPFIGQVWCNWANVCTEREEKYAHICKALALNSMNTNAYISLSKFYRDAGEYQKALDVFKETPWGTHLPFELISIQAEIFAEVGHLENAIDSLSSLLFKQSGHSNLWDKLYHYLFKLERKQDIVEACYKQIELNKHDAGSLCVAAENLTRVGDEKDQKNAKSYLHKAYELAPHNQYIVLTYADLLLTEKEYVSAFETLEKFKTFSDSPFVAARQVVCLLHLDKLEEAKAFFDSILDHPDSEYWCTSNPIEHFIKRNKFADIIALLERRLDTCTEVQAYVWADKTLEVRGVNHSQEILQKLRESPNIAFKEGVLRALYEYWNDNDIKPDLNVITEFKNIASQSNAIFEQLAVLLLRDSQYGLLMKIFEQANSTTFSMCSYYQMRAAYQLLERWDDAAKIIKLGCDRPIDGTVHNIRLWYCYELWRNGQVVSDEELDVIDVNELIDVEQYLYATLKVAVLLGDYDLESSLETITPALRRCQRISSSIGTNYFITHAKNLLNTRLKARISSAGFIDKTIMKWKLSNRF